MGAEDQSNDGASQNHDQPGREPPITDKPHDDAPRQNAEENADGDAANGLEAQVGFRGPGHGLKFGLSHDETRSLGHEKDPGGQLHAADNGFGSGAADDIDEPRHPNENRSPAIQIPEAKICWAGSPVAMA